METTEEEGGHGKDGGAGRLQKQNSEVDLCLGAVGVLLFTAMMAHRYLRLSSGCRSVFRLLLSPKGLVRQVGAQHANMMLSVEPGGQHHPLKKQLTNVLSGQENSALTGQINNLYGVKAPVTDWTVYSVLTTTC